MCFCITWRPYQQLWETSMFSVRDELRNVLGATTISPLNAELNPICHLLALLGGATIVVVSRLRVRLGAH